MAKTKDNLLEMFGSCAEAHGRYLAFAEAARAEGDARAERIFRAVATAKLFHALSHFRASGMVDSTEANIRQALEEETYDYKTAYPAMVRDAVAEERIPARHSLEYGMSIGPIICRTLSGAKSETDATEPDEAYFVCPVCGNIEKGHPPAKCPFCGVDAEKFVKVA